MARQKQLTLEEQIEQEEQKIAAARENLRQLRVQQTRERREAQERRCLSFGMDVERALRQDLTPELARAVAALAKGLSQVIGLAPTDDLVSAACAAMDDEAAKRFEAAGN